MMTIEQATEAMFATRWETERRCGVVHYRPGQIRVVEIEPEEGQRSFMLAYTPADGHGINAFVCSRRALDGPGSVFFWEVADNVRIRADGFGFSVEQLPSTYMLSRAMTDALDQAFNAAE